jgi:hypothetical protein
LQINLESIASTCNEKEGKEKDASYRQCTGDLSVYGRSDMTKFLLGDCT